MMGLVLGSVVGVAAIAVLAAVLLLIAYELFGAQALGLPAIIGVLALVGLVKLISDAGLGNLGVAFVVLGVLAIPFVIGMAMRLGADAGTRSGKASKPQEEPRENGARAQERAER